ncbi:unnamed protein product [Ambrosiozyma monospora]|uniref:Unnamed protein product n=1 Tax=Ambrosiozyma monospora TaxID=43982 RepID=A0ACB5TUX4_AMBMO|nr:unnamed protein product [Ambrosiozyma monospora]
MFELKYKDVPEVEAAYNLMPTVILKADFARYLYVYAYGGTYSDTDVWMRQPVDSWFDSNRNIGFACGIEDDRNNDDRWGWKSRPMRLQLNQWCFKSSPGHPILGKLIATIVSTTFQAQIDDKLVAWWYTFGIDECDGTNIMTWTGPRVFSDIIYSHFNSLKNPTIVDVSVKRMNDAMYGPKHEPGVGIDWHLITELDAPLVVGDSVVYPLRTLREGPDDCDSYCYVKHHYEGSWS